MERKKEDCVIENMRHKAVDIETEDKYRDEGMREKEQDGGIQREREREISLTIY